MRTNLFWLILPAVFVQGPVITAQSTPENVKPSALFAKTLRAELENGEYEPHVPDESHWLDGGERYTILEASATNPKVQDLAVYETASGKRSVLVPADKFIPTGQSAPLTIDDYQWSKGDTQMLIYTNAQKVWRNRTRGDYWILRLRDWRLTKLGGQAEAASLMFAKFSPDGQSVAYVYKNNLYVEDSGTGRRRQITQDGSPEVINGTSDWVTEEEFRLSDGFRWSPDSRTIAYWQFDQTGVGEYSLINDTDTPYPTVFRYRYPQAGGTNAAVRVGVVGIDGGATKWVNIGGDPSNQYIPRMEWIGDSDELVLENLNRMQNSNRVLIANAHTGETRVLYEDRDAAWLDIVEDLQWVPDTTVPPSHAHKRDLLWLSERDGWRHAYLLSRVTGQAKLITNFAADVIAPVFLDAAHGFFYFLASPNDPIRSYLFRSRLDGTGTPERVTPQSERGTHSYNPSPDGTWAIHNYSSASHPISFDIIKLNSHEMVRNLMTNEDLIQKDNALDPEQVEFTDTPVSDGAKLSTFIVKPPGFDPSRKYPMLVYVYGEPFLATVQDTWQYSYFKSIAIEGYVVVSFDNEGTPVPRGRAWRKSIYGALGVLSSQQQSEAIRAFEQGHSYIDSSRVGMWGNSGGASATLNEMFRYPGQVLAGVASSPMPDQRLYDSIYQERYMGLPSTNAKGYHDGSPINFAEGLTGHLLIIHGSGDDNVHFQATEKLVNRLVELGKPFDFMDYPNRTHSISEGPGTLFHYYSLILRYLEEYVPSGAR